MLIADTCNYPCIKNYITAVSISYDIAVSTCFYIMSKQSAVSPILIIIRQNPNSPKTLQNPIVSKEAICKSSLLRELSQLTETERMQPYNPPSLNSDNPKLEPSSKSIS